MKYIFAILCSIFLPVFSLNEITPKFCINCKFFKKKFGSDDKYAKCLLFTNIQYDKDYLVTGLKHIDYYFCSTARDCDNMCGKEGKMFKDVLETNK